MAAPTATLQRDTAGAAFDAAAPRLTKLELHGFKSFANRTVFTFERGITAIIGPNGSGKSNISDAVRWVLGEQSHASLRSKKTEDVIFAGGRGKPPSGMAEVAVTFDNSSNWLPSEYTEVTVTRRAFRSGENQYLINGRKVRLKDVALLTASLGHSHTVVGQGLVDTALSQRPEERRGLFEHAADLTGLRLKAAEAERNLAETETNTARITDLLTELEPRLKTLERAAKQAQEWRGVHERLQTLQRMHYARLLTGAITRLSAAEEGAAHEESTVALHRREAERLVDLLAVERIALERSRAAFDQHSARLQATVDQARRIGYERDLAHERVTALSRRREDMADTQAGLDEQVATVARDLAAVVTDLTAVEQEVATVRARTAEMVRAAASARLQRVERERAVARAAQTITDGERRGDEVARRRALLEQKIETDAAEQVRAKSARDERAQRFERLAAEIAAFDQAELNGQGELAALEARIAAIATEAEQAAVETVRTQNSLAELDRSLGQASARLDALKRIHESGTGLHAGVRDVLLAARAGKLRGVRGALAELLDVPARFDTALEVALGGHLQDIVVERWADAEAAIDLLKRNGSGRATFQPLDTVRAFRAAHPGLDALRRRPGVHGIAAELIDFPVEIDAVVTALLGRTLVVEDLPTARSVLPQLAAGWSAVTRGGEIARSGGSVTGGAAVRESGMLGRERELRELPEELVRLQNARAETHASATNAAAIRQGHIERRQGLEAERAALIAARREQQAQRKRLDAWLSEVRTELTGSERRIATLGATAIAARAQLSELIEEQAEQAEAIAAAARAHATARAALAHEDDANARAEAALSADQRQLAGLEERLRSERKREAGLLAQRRALDEELGLRATRAATLDGEITALVAQRERLARETEQLAIARDAISAEHAPLEIAVKSHEREIARCEKQLETARAVLLETERARGVTNLGVERARAELAAIRQRITDELDLTDPAKLLESEIVDAGDVGNPGEAEREIARLKDRLRRVGYVGENVVEEYEREAERHTFLRAQLADVHGASLALQKLLADLHATMAKRFDETFSKVAIAFTEMFTILFSGGTARLVMVAGTNGDGGGIDIVAQPPGKRLQSLGLLSGGERALTAAALLFAILKVNPTPFCLLDEVDAALDEANIVRFREQLRALAAETQAIIITHNRGTIEVADTLYGISMRDDGVSQVLSLRLADVKLASD